MAGLSQRLAAAGIEADSEPLTAWVALREAEGEAVTIIDLYEIGELPRVAGRLCAPAPGNVRVLRFHLLA